MDIYPNPIDGISKVSGSSLLARRNVKLLTLTLNKTKQIKITNSVTIVSSPKERESMKTTRF